MINLKILTEDAKESCIIQEYPLSSYLESSDKQDIELNWNLGGILQDVLQDFLLTTAGRSFKFVSFRKKPKMEQ